MNRRTRQRLEYLAAVYGPAIARRLYPDLLWRVDCGAEPALYLTFDDGPTSHLTPKILDVLNRNDVPAVFFLLGKHIQLAPDLVDAIETAGHRLGLHGFDHLDAWNEDPARVLRDLDRGLDLLSSLASAPVRYFRPPFGRFRKETRRWSHQRNLKVVMWDVMPGDYMIDASVRDIVARVRSRVRAGSIIVMHDSWNPSVVANTVAALEEMLPLLKDDGWQFELL